LVFCARSLKWASVFFEVYTPLHALAGGILIGLSSLLAILATGKTLGISGMFSRTVWSRPDDRGWRIVFLVGLLAGAATAFFAVGSASLYRALAQPAVWVALAGVLVGFGTRLGGGCTSGHGVCGLSLASKNSLVATLLFMGAGMFTVFLVRRFAGV